MALRFMFAFSIQTTTKIYFKSPTNQSGRKLQEPLWCDAFGQWFAFGTNRTQTLGIEIEANQINRYQNHSFWSNHGLFQYVQLFVISNGVNTKYWPTTNCNRSNKLSFGQMPIIKTPWVNQFAAAFLNPTHLGKMIAHYIVGNP
jgi:hypothetical protein